VKGKHGIFWLAMAREKSRYAGPLRTRALQRAGAVCLEWGVSLKTVLGGKRGLALLPEICDDNGTTAPRREKKGR